MNPDCLTADSAARILHCPSLRIMHRSHWVSAVCHVLNFYMHIQSSSNNVSRQERITHFTGKKNDTQIGKVHVQGHKASLK